MVQFHKYRAPRIISSQEGMPLWLRLLLLLLLILAAAWLGYQQGSVGGSTGFTMLPQDSKQQINLLEKERNDLRRELTMVKQAAEIDRESMSSVREKIKQFQDERLKMEEELVFLRGMVSAKSGRGILRLQRLRLQPGEAENSFLYSFTVTKVLKDQGYVEGAVFLTLSGEQDGKKRTFSLKELTKDKKNSLKMRFKYFQNVEGELLLPGRFRPSSVTIEVKPDGKKFAPVKKRFEWVVIG
ncbi:MAG: hypothetical protein P8Z39_06650 [Gammaproteobacteria bacterium]